MAYDIDDSVDVMFMLVFCVLLFVLIIVLNISAIIKCSQVCTADKVAVFMMDVVIAHMLIGLFSIPNITLYLTSVKNSKGSEMIRAIRSFFDFIANNAVSYTTCSLIMITMLNTGSTKPSHNPFPIRLVTWVCAFVTATLMFYLVKSDLYIIEDFSWGHVAWINIVYLVPSVVIFLLCATVQIKKLSPEGQPGNGAFFVNGIMVKLPILKCIVLIGSLFILSWFPLYSLEFVLTLKDRETVKRDFGIDYSISYIRCILFGYLNSVATPMVILYTFKIKRDETRTNGHLAVK